MSVYSTLAVLHGGIGVIALVTYWAAAFARKGTGAHRRIGRTYLLAMATIVATAVPMAVLIALSGRTVAAAFLGYLAVITASGVWGQWRSVRDRDDVARYTGPVYVALGVLSLLAGLGVLVLGLQQGQPLLAGFSLVGIGSGLDRLRKRRRRAVLAAQPRWWMIEHYNAVIGNGVATHIAFLAIGLPRLLPALAGPGLAYAAWFGPLLIAGAVKLLLDRRWKPRNAPTAARSRPALASGEMA